MENSHSETSPPGSVNWRHTISVIKRKTDRLKSYQTQVIQKVQDICKLKEELAVSKALVHAQHQEIVEYKKTEKDLRDQQWSLSEENFKLKKENVSLKATASLHEHEKKEFRNALSQLKAQLAETVQQRDDALRELQEMEKEMNFLGQSLDHINIENATVEERDQHQVASLACHDREESSLGSMEADTAVGYGSDEEEDDSLLQGLPSVVGWEAQLENTRVEKHYNSNNRRNGRIEDGHTTSTPKPEVSYNRVEEGTTSQGGQRTTSSSNLKTPATKKAPNANPENARRPKGSDFDKRESHAVDMSKTKSFSCICGRTLPTEFGLKQHINYYREKLKDSSQTTILANVSSTATTPFRNTRKNLAVKSSVAPQQKRTRMDLWSSSSDQETDDRD